MTNREDLLWFWNKCSTKQLAEELFEFIEGSDFACEKCLAGHYCYLLHKKAKENGEDLQRLPTCEEIICDWLEQEAIHDKS